MSLNSSKKILIISYTFPPAPGIGGRRWAKYGKYLHRNGFDISVIAAKNKNTKKSPWLKDIEEINGRIKYINFPYPRIISKTTYNLADKVLYRLTLLFLKFFSKGSFYDKTLFSKRKTRLLIEKRIKDGYKTIIATGAPFNVLFYTATLKKKYPELNIISDIRDPWTWGESYGMATISKKKRNQEKEKEKAVLVYSNFITVPSEAMQNKLLEKYPLFAEKIKLLPHAFDNDDFFFEKSRIKPPKNEKTQIIFGGAVYDSLEQHFSQLEQVMPKIINNCDFHFYTHDTQTIPVEIRKQVELHVVMPAASFFKKVQNADYYLILFPERVKDFISTKFYEIVKLRIPIIIISENGKAGDFIQKNGLGIHILPQNLSDKLPEFILTKTFKYNHNFNIDEFSYSHSTKKLERLLN